MPPQEDPFARSPQSGARPLPQAATAPSDEASARAVQGTPPGRDASGLRRLLPRGRGDMETQHGSRRATTRWPFHTRMTLRFEEVEGMAEANELSAVVLNMSAGGFRAVLARDVPGPLPAFPLPSSEEPPLEGSWRRDAGRPRSLSRATEPPTLTNERPPRARPAPRVGDRFHTKIETEGGIVVCTDCAEIVWLRSRDDGYVAGFRFVSPRLPY